MRYIDTLRSYLISNVKVLFTLAICAAVVSRFYPTLSLLITIIAVLLFMRIRFALIFIVMITTIRLISPSFFIVLDSERYKDDNVILKTSSASIMVSDNISKNIKIGTLIISDFKLDNNSKKYYRQRYFLGDNYTLIKLPLVTKILEYRNYKSEELFYLSAGRVSVSQALIFGDKRFIPSDVRDEYIISGLAHLLAMSGMHVGVISAIFMTFLFFMHTKLRFIFAIFGLLILILFGGFTITVVRAALFAIILMVAYIFDYLVDGKRFIILLAAMFILFSPATLMDISFLLSFGAVFGIFYLLNRKMGKVTSVILMGVAATLYTAPISLYLFSTTNHFSILSTVIMVPVIYAQIFTTIFTLVFTEIGLPALIYIESFANLLMYKIYDYTYFAFILKSIPLWVLIATIIFITATLLTRFKYLSLLSLLIIFYPAQMPPDYIFPNFSGSTKGVLTYKDNRSEIYFSGTLSQFKYRMLPIIARYGIKKFDYGYIRIFDGENLYIKTKMRGLDFTNLCINDYNSVCKVFYHTKSNSITQKNITDTKNIIYKNKYLANNIYLISELGEIQIDNGEVEYNDKNLSE